MSSWYCQWGKRTLDIGLSLFGLVLFAWPMAGIACVIFCQSGRPVLFHQARVGLRGRRFGIVKFRTMRGDDEVFSAFAHGLRMTAMDELPQLVHILRGQMSFVGPRPLVHEDLVEVHRLPEGPRRFSIRPGLTGLAQLNAIKVPSLEERLKWDLAYADQCSLWLDVRTIVKSVWVTLRGAWEEKSGMQPPGKG